MEFNNDIPEREPTREEIYKWQKEIEPLRRKLIDIFQAMGKEGLFPHVFVRANDLETGKSPILYVDISSPPYRGNRL